MEGFYIGVFPRNTQVARSSETPETGGDDCCMAVSLHEYLTESVYSDWGLWPCAQCRSVAVPCNVLEYKEDWIGWWAPESWV